MKRLFLFLALLLGVVVLVPRLLSSEFRQRLSQLPGRMIGTMIEHMPED